MKMKGVDEWKVMKEGKEFFTCACELRCSAGVCRRRQPFPPGSPCCSPLCQATTEGGVVGGR